MTKVHIKCLISVDPKNKLQNCHITPVPSEPLPLTLCPRFLCWAQAAVPPLYPAPLLFISACTNSNIQTAF